MRFQNSCLIKTSVSNKALLDALIIEVKKRAKSIKTDEQMLIVIKGLDHSFGAAYRDDETTFQITDRGVSKLITATTTYNSTSRAYLTSFGSVFLCLVSNGMNFSADFFVSSYFFVFSFFPLIFYFYHRTMIQKSLQDMLKNINNEFCEVSE